MAKQSKTVHKKTRGRPAGVKFSGTIPVRLEPAAVAAVDAWAAEREFSRSEAIRRLVDLALTATPGRAQSSQSRRRAAELAGNAIDKLADSSASDEEQTGRKRRLLKGPEAFRDFRLDREKGK